MSDWLLLNISEIGYPRLLGNMDVLQSNEAMHVSNNTNATICPCCGNLYFNSKHTISVTAIERKSESYQEISLSGHLKGIDLVLNGFTVLSFSYPTCV